MTVILMEGSVILWKITELKPINQTAAFHYLIPSDTNAHHLLTGKQSDILSKKKQLAILGVHERDVFSSPCLVSLLPVKKVTREFLLIDKQRVGMAL